MAKLLTLVFWASLLLYGDNVPSTRNNSKPIVVSQMDQRGMKAIPLVVAEDHKKTSEEIHRERADTDQHGHIERWMLYSNEATAVATILLVFVGIGGIRAALRTLREIGRQTKLQSIPFKSWIALGNWKADFNPDVNPLKRLRISVDIVNQTDFPITIIEGQIKVKILGGPGYTRYELGERTFLPPKSPYAVIVLVSISDSHAETFNNGLFVIPIEGRFSHFGQLGEESIFTQRFEGLLECGKGRENNFNYEIHLNPQNNGELGR